jgi:hypothetical protein
MALESTAAAGESESDSAAATAARLKGDKAQASKKRICITVKRMVSWSWKRLGKGECLLPSPGVRGVQGISTKRHPLIGGITLLELPLKSQ